MKYGSEMLIQNQICQVAVKKLGYSERAVARLKRRKHMRDLLRRGSGREVIRNENDLINQRLSWMFAAQAFLFAALLVGAASDFRHVRCNQSYSYGYLATPHYLCRVP
jgi:hypothetical protein